MSADIPNHFLRSELESRGIRSLTIAEEGYPELLKKIADPPPIIYVKGDLAVLAKPALAIVGTRQPSRYGLEAAEYFARELAGRGLLVVSGLALGIDTAAHQGALAAGGETIAVLGSGLDNLFPRANLDLSEQVVARGALLSEFPPSQPPDRWTFPRRNRIISGLTLGTIVIEGNYKSGAMITAKTALEQGREVFALPGNVFSELARGPHWLIKQGAKLVESIDDVLDELKFILPGLALSSQTEAEQLPLLPPPELNAEEAELYQRLSLQPQHLDSLAIATGWPTARVSSVLMSLELKKTIRQLPGKHYVLK